MTYTVKSTANYGNSKFCRIDLGDGSTVELAFPLDATTEQIFAGVDLFKEQQELQQALKLQKTAELEAAETERAAMEAEALAGLDNE